MEPAFIFFLALLMTIMSFTFAREIEDSKLDVKTQNVFIFIYLAIACGLWTYLYWLSH